ncbi:hypothetical protein PL8927_330043 [Planktothrix serta PCC 8927]|uniref:Uncharacterized protein n=1 Tax=Planktothrix serta PCC 8927 TaxID=671068 RepID=A0A7Z9BIH3_9CYAN|nr:hypothetical protein PL8927_330043 [Planktothrix serta PCC 8927]
MSFLLIAKVKTETRFLGCVSGVEKLFSSYVINFVYLLNAGLTSTAIWNPHQKNLE